MLDTRADRERLGLDMHAAAVQHGERVARAVADRQHDVVGVDLLPAGEGEAADVALRVEFDVRRRGRRSGIRRRAIRFSRECLRPP